MPYDNCVIDLTKKGFSAAAAARACAIAAYEKTGMTPGNPEIKKQKGSVSRRAEKIATSLSARPINLHQVDNSNEHFRLNFDINDSFQLAGSDKEFRRGENSGDAPPVNPFEPMYIQERGYSPRMLREVFLIRKGTFNDIPFDDADLQALIDNWDRPIPFQIDHKTDYQSNVGQLLSVRKEGSRVYGLAEVVGYSAINDIKTGRMREVSIGFYLKPRKLIEFSATKFPAVGGKDPAQIINPEYNPNTPQTDNPFFSHPAVQEALNNAATDTGFSPTLNQTRSLQDNSEHDPTDPIIRLTSDQIDQEKLGVAPAKGKDMTGQDNNPAGAPPVASLSNEMILANFQKQLDSVQAQLKAEQDKSAKLSSRLEETEGTLKLQRNTGIVVDFARKGFTTPDASKDELEFINGLSEEALNKYIAFKEKNGSVVPQGKLSTPETNPPGEASSESKDAKKARLKADYGKGKGVQPKTESLEA